MSRILLNEHRSPKEHANRRSGWVVPLLSFLLGLWLCQALCGAEWKSSTDEKQEDKPSKPSVKQPEPATERPELRQLGGEAGFGAGPTIGSGVAQIVIEPEQGAAQAKSTSFQQDTTQRLTYSESTPQVVNRLQVPVKRIPASDPAQPAGFRLIQPKQDQPKQDLLVNQSASIPMQSGCECSPANVLPEPLSCGTIYNPDCPSNPWSLDRRKNESVFNGGDQGKRVTVDSSWNVYNLNPEDTVGHFDTLDGRRLVTPSNRVAVYAPRFGAVRKLDGLVNSETRLKVGSMDERKSLNVSESQDFSTTTKQHLGLERFNGTKRASGLRENTRGVTSDNVLFLQGARNVFEAFENLSLFRLGLHQNSENARLGLGMQSANVWQDNLGVQVSVKGAQPVIVNDVYKVQQIVRIDSDDKHAILRVCKVASKISARPGEPVDFSIRFDNLTGRAIGNVTIIDNLASRLDYVPDSAESSLKANFSFERNEVGSLVLRWEIIDPMPANSGGIIRFRCRVR